MKSQKKSYLRLFTQVFLGMLVILLLAVGSATLFVTAASLFMAPDQFASFLDTQVELVGSWLLFSLATGLISMIIIDTGKSLFRFRGLFFQHAVPQLTGLSASDLRELLPPSSRSSNLLPAHLDMPIEQFTAQLSNRLDQAINLVGLLRSRADNLLPSEKDRESREFALLLAFIDQVHTNSGQLPNAHRSIPKNLRRRLLTGDHNEKSLNDSVDAWLTDIRMEVDQKLDSLQTSLTSQWSWLMRFTASVLSVILMTVVLGPFFLSDRNDPVVIAGLCLAAFLIGGYFAGFSHDFLRLLRRGQRK